MFYRFITRSAKCSRGRLRGDPEISATCPVHEEYGLHGPSELAPIHTAEDLDKADMMGIAHLFRLVSFAEFI